MRETNGKLFPKLQVDLESLSFEEGVQIAQTKTQSVTVFVAFLDEVQKEEFSKEVLNFFPSESYVTDLLIFVINQYTDNITSHIPQIFWKVTRYIISIVPQFPSSETCCKFNNAIAEGNFSCLSSQVCFRIELISPKLTSREATPVRINIVEGITL